MPEPLYDPDATRASLLVRLRDWQDAASWQEFFEKYWRLIYGVARKAGLSDGEAQDVVQETLAAVAKHMPGFRYDRSLGSFKGWLLKLTRWRITDQFRKRLPVHEPPSEAGTQAGSVESFPDPQCDAFAAIWEADWRQNLIDAAMDRVKRHLDPEKFQIFDCYVNKEWPAQRVAETFNIPVDHVYMARHRILELIKKEVERLEPESDAGAQSF